MTEDREFEKKEMFQVVCSECGKDTEVPFKPDENRAVYCKECYQKRRPKRDRY